MTDTLEAETYPAWPMERSAEDPWAPPPGLLPLRDKPAFRVTLPDGSTPWLLTRFDDQCAVLSDDRFSADMLRPGYPVPTASFVPRFRIARPLVIMDNPEHDLLRRTLAPAFTIKKIQRLQTTVEEQADILIDKMIEKGPALDLVTEFGNLLPSMVFCDLMGVPFSDHEIFIHAGHTFRKPDLSDEEAKEVVTGLANYMARVIDERGDNPGDDLIGRLMTEQYLTGKYTLEETAGIAIQVLIAGHDTTANMIPTGIYTLLQHPDQLELLLSGQVPWENAIEELMRYIAPAQWGLRRQAIEDVEIAGVTIRAGEGLILPVELANKEPGIFENPDKFDVTRQARHHLSFSYGIHQCIGAPLAKAELKTAYVKLFERLPNLRLADDPADIKFRHSFVYGVEKLVVTWDT